MKIRILNSAEVRAALPMLDAIQAMKLAFGQFSAGRCSVPLRSRIEVKDRMGVILFMPALLAEDGEMALKVVSVFPENLARDLPTIHALVIALDPKTGLPRAVMEGGTLTAIRTGAAAGAATDLLARPEAERAAIIGAGVQAHTQLEAVCAVRQIQTASIFSLHSERSQAFADAVAAQSWAPDTIRVVQTAAEATATADVICAATTSSTPVFGGADVRAGTHINAIGSFTPEMQEIPPSIVERSLLCVDSREAALAEAGDLIIPLREGRISEEHIHAELGEIINGVRPGRTDARQITLFKSVGLAVQDASAAGLALRRAEQLGLGKLVDL